MPETFEQFIARRLAELEEEEKDIRERLAEITGEKRRIFEARNFHARRFSSQSGGNDRYPVNIRPRSIMDDVVKILETHPEGLIALDILAKINKKRDIPIERTSLSPQLSRLRQRGMLVLDGSTWRLAGK